MLGRITLGRNEQINANFLVSFQQKLNLKKIIFSRLAIFNSKSNTLYKNADSYIARLFAISILT